MVNFMVDEVPTSGCRGPLLVPSACVASRKHKRHQRTPSIELLLSSPDIDIERPWRHKSLASSRTHKKFRAEDDNKVSPGPATYQRKKHSSLASSSPMRYTTTSSSSGRRVWPFDFYADEMDAGFKRCRFEANKQRPVESIFWDHFRVKFTKSTFYDHRRHWMGVRSSVREWYIGHASGHTEDGCWSTFLHQEIKGDRRMGTL